MDLPVRQEGVPLMAERAGQWYWGAWAAAAVMNLPASAQKEAEILPHGLIAVPVSLVEVTDLNRRHPLVHRELGRLVDREIEVPLVLVHHVHHLVVRVVPLAGTEGDVRAISADVTGRIAILAKTST